MAELPALVGLEDSPSTLSRFRQWFEGLCDEEKYTLDRWIKNDLHESFADDGGDDSDWDEEEYVDDPNDANAADAANADANAADAADNCGTLLLLYSCIQQEKNAVRPVPVPVPVQVKEEELAKWMEWLDLNEPDHSYCEDDIKAVIRFEAWMRYFNLKDDIYNNSDEHDDLGGGCSDESEDSDDGGDDIDGDEDEEEDVDDPNDANAAYAADANANANANAADANAADAADNGGTIRVSFPTKEKIPAVGLEDGPSTLSAFRQWFDGLCDEVKFAIYSLIKNDFELALHESSADDGGDDSEWDESESDVDDQNDGNAADAANADANANAADASSEESKDRDAEFFKNPYQF